MVRRTLLFSAMAALVISGLTGCGNGTTPIDSPERQAAAKKAGETVALAYLSLEKPTDEQATAISVVLGRVSESLTDYRDGGFITALPGIEEALQKAIPEDKKAERILASKLAKTLLEELDKLFEKHPEWQDKAVPVAALVGAFVEGGKEGFEQYINN